LSKKKLDNRLHAIRRALGEKTGKRQFINTIRKHGYRFVAEVRGVHPEEINDDAVRRKGELRSNGNSSAATPRSLKKI
jgi:DNA-binding winged helix-turn-helix (wHTH) protein